MEAFIQEVREQGQDIEMEVPFKIDGIKGYLSVEFNHRSHEYEIGFEWFDYRDRNVVVDNVKTPEEVGEWIILFKHGKFLGDEPVFTENRKKWIQHIRNIILENEQRDFETCYVCFEDTHEYKTPCHHDICYPCFVKTLQLKTGSKRDFICGICRKKTELR